MIHLTEVYDWEGDASVKQRLIFLCEADKEAFEHVLPDFKNTADGSLAENGKGAFAKLRALRQFDGLWVATIRSGFTGYEVFHGHVKYDSWQEAIQEALWELANHLSRCIELASTEPL